jgi:hypothetical protein
MPHLNGKKMASAALQGTTSTALEMVTGASSNPKIANRPKLAMLTRLSSHVTGGYSVAMRLSSSIS